MLDYRCLDCEALDGMPAMSSSIRIAASPAADATAANAMAMRLGRTPLLAGASPEALRSLAAKSRWRVLAAGEVILDTGDAGQEVFFVVEGAVRVVLRSASGDELILNELTTGDFFGELAAIDGVARSANVTALLRACICRVPGEGFMELVLSTPAIGRRLLQLLTARLRAKDERTLEVASLTTRERVLAELLRLARNAANGECIVSPPPPRQVLAARLGLRRETISRELAKLVRTGLLSTRRTAVVIHNADQLRAELRRQLRGSA
jgi:CRP-like cAMP-binding protein